MIISIEGKKDFYFPDKVEKLEELRNKCLHTPKCVDCEYAESCIRMFDAIGVIPTMIKDIYVV